MQKVSTVAGVALCITFQRQGMIYPLLLATEILDSQ